jgi:phospholipid/cholesterol/gamma-HCH transport system substrate-binding protein
MVMLSQRTIESFVGLFLLVAMIAFAVLAFKVSGLTSFFKPESYYVSAQFDEIGGLKVRASVKVSGVLIGEVTDITLDPTSYKALVTMRINSIYNDIPEDSSANILTAGLLGDNYIALTPMYSTSFLKNGSTIQETHPAIILEKLIGQLMFKLGGSDSKTKTDASAKIPAEVSTDTSKEDKK